MPRPPRFLQRKPGGLCRGLAPAAVAALALASAPPAHASEPEIIGLGGRSLAMAGTGAADATGYDATYGYVARSLRLLRTAVGPEIPSG